MRRDAAWVSPFLLHIYEKNIKYIKKQSYKKCPCFED